MNSNESGIELARERERRDRAIACAVLSFAVSLALVISNLGPDRRTENALAAVRQHKVLLAQNEQVLNANAAELAQDKVVLENLRKSLRSPQ